MTLFVKTKLRLAKESLFNNAKESRKKLKVVPQVSFWKLMAWGVRGLVSIQSYWHLQYLHLSESPITLYLDHLSRWENPYQSCRPVRGLIRTTNNFPLTTYDTNKPALFGRRIHHSKYSSYTNSDYIWTGKFHFKLFLKIFFLTHISHCVPEQISNGSKI